MDGDDAVVVEVGEPPNLSEDMEGELKDDMGRPAAPHRGRVLAWHAIRCSVQRGGRERGVVEILHGVSGRALAGELVAVVGPSGAGKSTFMDVLSCRKTVGCVRGLVAFNGQPTTRSLLKRISSYVTQEDMFHPTLTVLETVMFHAQMRLGRRRGMTYDYPDKLLAQAQRVIKKAGLNGKESTRVGGILPGGLGIRGISGGEKRRLALCCTSVTNPQILFADEPTSGLDSLAALMIIHKLRDLCNEEGTIILCNIHQPRQAIWVLFDKVVVLGKGHQLFYGSPAQAEQWFTSGLGLTCPTHTSVPDFILDQVDMDFEKASGDRYDKHPLTCVADLEKLARSFHDSFPHVYDVSYTFDQGGGASSYGPLPHDMHGATGFKGLLDQGWWFKYRVLLARACRSEVRNPGNLLARVGMTASIALIAGSIWINAGAATSKETLGNILGSLFLTFMTINIIPYCRQSAYFYDRRFYNVENAAGIYPCSAYYAANVTMDLLFSIINGLSYGGIIYALVNYQAFLGVGPSSLPRAGMSWAFLGIAILMTLMANAQAYFFGLLCPSQEVAFVLGAGYVTLSALTTGMLVSIPHMGRYGVYLHHISMIKYPYQAVLRLFFQDNPHTLTPLGQPVEHMLADLQLDMPPSLGANLVVCVGFYVVFTAGGFLALKTGMWKERR